VIFRKLRAASDVAVAAVAVLRARRSVARRPIGTLVERDVVSSAIVTTERRPLSVSEESVGARWGAATDRALRWIPGDSACLVRASALRDLVVRRGLELATVRIGVRRGANGFEAHAWVEHVGMPIAEPVGLQGAFNSLDGVTLR
jgi:Transglutaminase-like superfamily